MTILVYAGNKNLIFLPILVAYMICQTTMSVFSVMNLIVLILSSVAFKKIPLIAIPTYSVMIDSFACINYELPWLSTVIAGLLWNMKWIALSGVIEIACRAYRCRRTQLPELTSNEAICLP